MGLNQFGEVSDTATDVHGGGGIWNLNGIEDGPDALIRLKPLLHAHDSQGAGIEREGVFRRAEELGAKAHHGGPVKPNDDNDNAGDNINHADMSPKDVASNVTNGEHGELVAVFLWNLAEIV